MKRKLLAVTVLTLALPATADEGWTRFRGPNGSGVSDSPAPTAWGLGDIRWKTDLPGEGHSSPVLQGGSVFVTSTNPDTAEQWLVCLNDGDGAIRWKLPLDSQPYGKHRFNSFASATPAVDEARVYVPVSSAEHHQIVAVSLEGKEVWRYDLGPYSAQHGSGVSPIVYRDTVIYNNDQDGESFVVAMDRATGKPIWKTPRPSDRAAYGTPAIVAGPDGGDQLVISSKASGVTALDPATGRVIWEMGGLFEHRTVFSPIVAGGLVIAGSGEGPGGKRLVAIRPGSADGSKAPELVYEVDKALPYVPTPLSVNGLLFLLADGGIVTCVDAGTGELKWRERIGGDHFASPVCAGGVIYCVARNGKVATIRAADAYQPIAVMQLDAPANATPGLAAGAIYLRTETQILKIGP